MDISLSQTTSLTTNLVEYFQVVVLLQFGIQKKTNLAGGIEKTQVTYQNPDGLGKKNPRSSVFLPYDWSSRNQSKITTAVADLKRLMEERNLSLKEATKFLLEPAARDQAPSITNWKNIVKHLLNQETSVEEQ